MGTGAEMIVEVGKRSLAYGGMVLQDIPEDRFARLAEGGDGPVNTNHPAHIVGHLCLYPSRVIAMGWEDDAPVRLPEELEARFRPGAECVDDPAGEIYPSKADLCQRLVSGYNAAFSVVSGWSDEKLAGAHCGADAYRKMFPTLGIASNFLLCAHMMMHLGQISAWRRIEGMGSVM